MCSNSQISEIRGVAEGFAGELGYLVARQVEKVEGGGDGGYLAQLIARQIPERLFLSARKNLKI